jgi:pyrophosphatase PpaX
MERTPDPLLDQKVEEILRRRRLINPDFRDEEEAREMIMKRLDKTVEFPKPVDIEKIADAVLLDWDGVLYDSVEISAKAGALTLKGLGKSIEPEEFRDTYSAPYGDYYGRHGIPMMTEEDREKVHQVYHEQVIPALRSEESPILSKMYKEVESVLRSLKEKGLHIAIVSAAPPMKIENELEQLGYGGFIDEIISGAHEKYDAIRDFCDRKGIPLDRTIMFGDLPSDITDGKKAGVRTAGVARTDSNKDRLGAYDPDFMVSSLEEIFTLKTYVDESEK